MRAASRFESWEGALAREAIPNRLPADVVRELSVLRPHLTLATVAADWAMIGLAIWMCEAYFNPALFVMVCAFIGARQHGLEILMHEGVHYRFHPNRIVNDWLSDVTSAWPTAITTNFYRCARHFDHHRNIGCIDDPHVSQTYQDSDEWEFPKNTMAMVCVFLKDMVGGPRVVWVTLIQSSRYYASSRQQVVRWLFYAVVLSLLVGLGLGRELIAYWLVPLCFWTPVLHRFRLMAEHFGIGDPTDRRGAMTRSTVARSFVMRWLDKAFIVPHNLNYHIEHHYYPSVPFYCLPRLHEHLRSAFGRYGTSAFHVTDGYISVWRELTRRNGKKTE